MTQPNFEAIGRYHATLEAFRDLRVRRSTALSELSRIVRQSIGRHDRVVAFDGAAVEEKLQRAISVNAELMQCIDALNEYAAETGKPQITIDPPSRY